MGARQVTAARQLTLDGPRNECVFSFDRRYRYLLKRKVAESGGVFQCPDGTK